jgi:hypothetical protein
MNGWVIYSLKLKSGTAVCTKGEKTEVFKFIYEKEVP